MDTKHRDGYFYNPTKGNLTFNQMVKELLGYIKEKPEQKYEIVVGCDSSSGDRISFPVAVVILRVGAGGRFFLKRVKYPSYQKKKFTDYHQRILQEVLLSCEIALLLKEVLVKKVKSSSSGLDYQFRYIHADIGEEGKTRDMIREVVGLIKSNGFEAKIKPESFAASVVADRFT